MAIKKTTILKLKAPFKVRRVGKKRVHTITHFTSQDPLGVGGGLMPNMPTAYFKGGGWLLVEDLMQQYSLVR